MNTVLEIVSTMQKIPKPEYENCVSEEGNINTTEIKWLFKISWDHLATSGWQLRFQTFERKWWITTFTWFLWHYSTLAEVHNIHHGKLMREESDLSGVKIIDCSKEGVKIRNTENV